MEGEHNVDGSYQCSSGHNIESHDDVSNGEVQWSDSVGGNLLSLESRLSPGSTLDSPESAYVLYCEYARLKGFSVKKGTQAYFSKTNIIRIKVYLCSCEGKTDNRAAVEKIPKYRKQHFRTDCQARLRIVRENESAPWTVRLFVVNHNHPLLECDEGYLLRSSRNLTHAKRSILETFNDAGIGMSRAYRYMEKTAGGRANVGFTCKDANDHIGKLRSVTKIENYDADALLKYFQSKAHDEPYFYWNVKLDDDGRLMHFFFRDCRAADDYKSFGDVVSVDTTFKTNKYNLLCTPIVGINHHRQNILFGIAFLSEETIQSFEWLFKTFLESMDGKEPGIIISDQDQALVKAIDSTFTRAAHRLCQWHISENAGTHFGKLSHDAEFREMWYKCMNGCETEREFEETWNLMLLKYGLVENRWFANMYTIRARWADVYVNDRFTAGIRATSRSESTNKTIKDLCASSTSLSEFVKHYEGIIQGWRIKEREEDVVNYGIPGQRIDGNRLLENAARFYTRNVYHLFELEAMSCINVNIIHTLVGTASGDMSFTVITHDDPTERVVTYHVVNRIVSCSCQMLVTRGYFCRHILKVFFTLNVDSLPDQYLLKRWSKAAKHRSPHSWTTELLAKDRGSNMIFKNQLMRIAYDLGFDVEDNIPLQGVTLDKFRALADDIKKMKDPTLKVKRTRKPYANKKGSKKFKDPPIPTHGWLPIKRRSTVLDKREAMKGAANMNNQDRNTNSNDQSQDLEVNAADCFIIPLEEITQFTPVYNNSC